jgi:hypothetical protein
VQLRARRYGAGVDQRARIGNALRSARERLSLSIEQAADGAGVPLHYARLLEGEVRSGIGVSDELYLIPFFRRYASSLGMNAEELLPDFIGEVQDVPIGTVAPPSLTYRSPIAALWRPAAITLAITIAIVLLMRQTPERPSFEDDQFARVGTAPEGVAGEDERIPDAGGAPAEAVPPVGEPSEDVAPPQAAPPPPGVADVAASEPSAPQPAERPPPEGRELRIVADEETWLAIGVDDEPKKEFLLQPGEARTWNARDAFVVTLGNAGGVTLLLDGHELPRPGKSGDVIRDLRLPRIDGDVAPQG